MAITELLQQILSARYGRDVRQSIHDAIRTCYDDGKAGAIDLTAREQIEATKGDITTLQGDTTQLKTDVQTIGGDVETLGSDVDQLNKDLNGFAFKTEDGEKKVYNPTTEAWEDFGSGASTWDEVQNKPFSTIGANLSVDESGALNAEASSEGLIHITWAEYQALPETEKNSKDYVVIDAPDELTIAEVDEKVEQVKNDLLEINTNYKWVALTNARWSAKVRKNGTFGELYFSFNETVEAGTHTIGQLPSGYLPAQKTINRITFMGGGNVVMMGLVEINVNGTVTLTLASTGYGGQPTTIIYVL